MASAMGWPSDSAPMVVEDNDGVEIQPSIAAGEDQSLALKTDGTVWGWGTAFLDGYSYSAPTQGPGLSGVNAIVAGHSHNFALLSDGTVRAWGVNSVGQLGDGTRDDSESPVQVVGLDNVIAISARAENSLALQADGSVVTWGKRCTDGA